jgi:archaemetzincin
MKKLIMLVILFVSVSYASQDSRTVYIQPLGKVSEQYLSVVKDSVESFYGFNCILLPAIKHEKAFYAPSRTRYDARKIIDYYKYSSSNHLLLITERDITVRKSPTVPEYGVMGLGYMPGNTCIISSFRLRSSSERLAKVAVHELGHNLGLDHCTKDNTCLMSAANGKLSQIDREQFHFCKSCKSKLQN